MNSNAEKKVRAALRAKQSLKHAWDRIDYYDEVVAPAIAQVREIEKTSNVVLTEGDLNALLTTGDLAIEQGTSDEG